MDATNPSETGYHIVQVAEEIAAEMIRDSCSTAHKDSGILWRRRKYWQVNGLTTPSQFERALAEAEAKDYEAKQWSRLADLVAYDQSGQRKRGRPRQRKTTETTS